MILFAFPRKPFILKWTIKKKELSLPRRPSFHHLPWLVYSIFQSCGEKWQIFVCGQRRQKFIKPIPNKKLISAEMQLALKHRQQIREIPHYFGFSGRTEEMGTWGCRGDNAHLRHVTSQTISWCTDSATQQKSERRRKEDRGKDWKGERDGTHMAPQVQCCISNPVVKE